nr:IS701 family transposase [Glycomyces buryatensis]
MQRSECHVARGLRVLAVGETGDVKKGAATVGVQRQYSGTAGRIENCQLAVYLALATAAGHAAIDVRLYLPKVWADDARRRERAGVPELDAFQTKPELAADMIEAALDAGVGADFATGDEAYGINPVLRSRLQQRRLSYVLAIARTTPVILGTGKATAETALGQVPGAAWQTRSAGAGAKGLRRYDWAWVDLDPEGGGQAGLLARRNRTTGEIAYDLTWTATPVPLQTLVTVAGMRWRIEATFQGAKELAALDEHQVRTLDLLAPVGHPRRARVRLPRHHPRHRDHRDRFGHDPIDLQRDPPPHGHDDAAPRLGASSAGRPGDAATKPPPNASTTSDTHPRRLKRG